MILPVSHSAHPKLKSPVCAFPSQHCFDTFARPVKNLLQMEKTMRPGLIMLVCIGILPLMGCQTLGLNNPPPDVADPGPICPATAVLSDAATVTKLKPGTSAARV